MQDLGLQAQAERHLAFLTESGYRCVESTPSWVRFESANVFVELVFDGNRSYELGLLFGLKRSARIGVVSFSIAELLRLRGAEEADRFSLIQVTSPESLASFVEQLAKMLRTYGSDIILGNEEIFAELAEQRQREVKAFALEGKLRMARAQAERAWRNKDYATVVAVLAPLRSALTPSEIGKLEFAEKRARQASGS
jgi:hypothetical protein